MRNYLGISFVICAACAQTVDAPTNAEPPSNAVISSALTTDADGFRTVTLDLGNARVLEFTEDDASAWVFEHRPMGTLSVLGADTSAPALYRAFSAANPDLPELFANFPALAAEPNTDPQVGVTANALTKDEFLAGTGICAHYCESVEFQEHSTYPYESSEKCRTDILGRDFRPLDGALGPAVDTFTMGEKLFFAVNARSTGGTFKVNRYIQQWTFENGEVIDAQQSPVTTKTRVIEKGEAFSAGSTVLQTGDPNVYRRGTAWAELIGDDEATYDYYSCGAVSRQ